MTAFSFTAPCITEEQEQKERDELSEEERKAIEADLFGTHQNLVESPEMVEEAVAQFHQAVDNLPMDDKAVYLESLEKCSPRTIEIESSPVRFLRAVDYNPELAAKRIALYWSTRKEIFQDRAFLPMRLEGGCLNEDEVQFISESWRNALFLLPHDAHGRAVMYKDKRRNIFSSVSREGFLRVYWYLVHVALTDESVQFRGFVMINNAHLATSLKQFDRVYMRMQYNSVRNCLPIKVRGIHTCHVPSLMAFFFPVLKFIMGRDGRLRHRVHSETPIITSLEQYGLHKEVVPTLLSGNYKYDGPTFLTRRRKIEAELYKLDETVPPPEQQPEQPETK